MITGENFKGGIEVVKRINSEVNRLVREKKDAIVDMLSYDVFAGAKAYETYMETVGKWFAEEQKLFAKNKALVDKAVAKANFENLTKRFSPDGRNQRTGTGIEENDFEAWQSDKQYDRTSEYFG